MAGLGIKINKNTFTKGNEAKKNFKGNDYPDDAELGKGTYSTILYEGRGVETSNGPQIVFDLLVGDNEITDDSAGKRVSLWFSLDTEENEGKQARIVYLYKFLEQLGFDADNLDEAKLVKILAEIKASPRGIQITAKQKGDHLNLRMKKVLEGVDLTDILASYEGPGGATEEEGVDLEKMNRSELKKYIVAEKLPITVFAGMSDDKIRELIVAKSK
jgi:hypothetical protein